jgi:hypothetical protein
MAVFLRLLLAICLVATAVPAPMAHAAADAAPTAAQEADAGGPPCHQVHAPAATPDAPAPQDTHGCCSDGGACDGGCGCLHAAGLPTTLPPAAAAAVPQGPAMAAIRSAAPPRLSPPVRPPIA